MSDPDWGYFGRSLDSPRSRRARSGRGRAGRNPRERDYGQHFGAPYWDYVEAWWIVGPETGRGPRGYQRSDERIREDVCDRLMLHGRIDATQIEVDVRDGEVSLRGEVSDRQTKRMAADTAESVIGIKNVHNELRVRRGQEPLGQQPRPAQPGEVEGEQAIPGPDGQQAQPGGPEPGGTGAPGPRRAT